MTPVRPQRLGPPQDLDRIVAEACAAATIQASRFRSLRHFANAVYLIEDVPVVARVAYGPGAIERSTRAVSIARWLGAQGLPVTEPATTGNSPQPITVDSDREVAVTFWRYYPQPIQERAHDPASLAVIARSLHLLRPPPSIPLPEFQPMRSVSEAVKYAEPGRGIGADEINFLRYRISELLDDYCELTFPLGVGLIHGDMYAGNLLWVEDRRSVVLGDWDSVCVGPREIDLAPTFTSTRFGLSATAVDRFASAYGYDLRQWPGYRILRAMREMSTLTALVRLAPADSNAADELRHRVGTLRRGDASAVWTAQ
jgi:hypothetical protein